MSVMIVKRWGLILSSVLVFSAIGGAIWFQVRYHDAPTQTVVLTTFSNTDYPEDPEERSAVFGNYPHGRLIVQQTDDTHFRFQIEPASNHSTSIELIDVDLAHFVAAIPRWVHGDQDLTKIGLIDREWNRQQVRFARSSSHVHVRKGGDGFEQRALSRVDLARNCLNAGLWELLLFTAEDGEERVYEHLWFTFPLGLYKQVFERVNGLSYWSYWWSLEHWVDPSGTPIRVDRLRTVEQEWPIQATALWDEPVAAQGEQVHKRKNILTPVATTYLDWYTQPVRFSSFIPPGRYSWAHPRETQLHYLAELTSSTVRQVQLIGGSPLLLEIELAFRSNKTGEATRLILGGLDGAAIPVASPDHYDRGWQVPLGIGNPSFFETYDTVVENPPTQRAFYGFHLDAKNRWLDHHAIGVDGPLLHWDAEDPSLLHLYLLSYERHALLNHVVITMPAGLRNRSRQTGPEPTRAGLFS